MDACCLNRPFDDLSQERIKLESEAILSILSRCQSRRWSLVGSPVIDLELGKITNVEKLKKVRMLYTVKNEILPVDLNATQRANEFQQYGIKTVDSLHLAVAEFGGVDIFLTTDDNFLKITKRIQIKIKAENPVTWFMEVLKNEH